MNINENLQKIPHPVPGITESLGNGVRKQRVCNPPHNAHPSVPREQQQSRVVDEHGGGGDEFQEKTGHMCRRTIV